MNNLKFRYLLLIPLLLTSAFSLFAYEKPNIDYPSGYRHWVHVKSVLIDEMHPYFKDFGGIHHIYANDKALIAMQNKTKFPDGSVLVFDLIKASAFKGGIEEGKRRRLDVMQKDAKKFQSTGGWGYGSFKEDTDKLVLQDVAKKCYSCHEGRVDKDYVYSSFRQ